VHAVRAAVSLVSNMPLALFNNQLFMEHKIGMIAAA
jgi:hypothetical protein